MGELKNLIYNLFYMDILYNKLPSEMINNIFLYLRHPCAEIIEEEIKNLNCNKVFKFKNKGKLFAVVNGRDFFSNEYFRQFNYDSDDEDYDFIDKITELLFNVSSDTSSDEDTFNNN